MIVERSTSREWLSNSWLVADRPGGHAVLIDAGAPPEPILRAVRENRLTVTHLLCTHHHVDHVVHADVYRARLSCPKCGHVAERTEFGGLDVEIGDGDTIASGGLTIRALHVPGHTRGQLAFVVGDERVFTGDTLFRGSVGGTRAPGHAGFEDLRRSILEKLMRLSPAMTVHPGHAEDTTIGDEWEANPFIRAWRGIDPVEDRPCLALGRPARLLLRARDYDGGTKCWVRFADGALDIIAGSRVESPSS